MSDNYHYKTPQYCSTCNTELERGWLDKGRPYYHCPVCDLYWTQKELRLEKKQRRIIAQFNETGNTPPTLAEPDYTGTLFEGLNNE